MKKHNCLICRHSVEQIISFGRMPIANGFLTKKQVAREYFYQLAVGFCQHCTMVQLINLVDREKMFHENYAFYSSTSVHMQRHFELLARLVMKKYLSGINDPFVAEIGSNDGILLTHFAKKGIRHLGIEPSANVAQAAVNKGINTLCEFFDKRAADKIIKQYGYVDVFLGANVICHIPNIHSVVSGIKKLLNPKGIFIFEDPYVGDIIQKTSYDQIYDEHAFYFSVHSVAYLMKEHGLEIIDVSPQEVHGGSMRYTISYKGAYKISPVVENHRKKEKQMELDKIKIYGKFRKKVEQSKVRLTELLEKLKKQRKSVAGYGATSKSTTVTNYCGITPDLVSCIYDTTPIKIGKYSPGAHIPVRDYKEFSAHYPDYALLFAWNHKKEIMEKEQRFLKSGGKFITYIPRVTIRSSTV